MAGTPLTPPQLIA